MSVGILVSGNIVLDLVVRPVEQVTWGITQWVESIEQHLGGNGGNTAAAISSLGGHARLLGRIGRDAHGEACRARLQSAEVDLAYLETGERPTATSIALVQSGGARTFLHLPGASLDVFANGIQFASPLLDGCGHYHLANLFALPHLRPLAAETLRDAQAAGLTTSLDTAWDSRGEWMKSLEPCLPHLDVLFVNEDEAHMLTGLRDPADHAAAFGVPLFVMKLGAGGCYVATREGAAQIVGFAVEAVDTTGAGDCFAGAFLAALARGMHPFEAGQVANAVGALTVQHLGSTTGLRSWDDTVAWMATR
ncbi:MAG: carbohydrate kinase family protein [Bryobacteraceae bacterium]|nr:carbohydrate kinase family protein [Bryobacteraceae bacterium]